MTFFTKNFCLLSSIQLACSVHQTGGAPKSFCTWNASRKTSSQKIRACRLSTTWPTILRCLGSNVPQVHNRHAKVTFAFNEFTALNPCRRFNTPVKLHFSTFYANLHNFWTHNYFHKKFGGLMSNYLIYKPQKCKIKILTFGWVIENSLGDYFFLTHSVYCLA